MYYVQRLKTSVLKKDCETGTRQRNLNNETLSTFYRFKYITKYIM